MVDSVPSASSPEFERCEYLLRKSFSVFCPTLPGGRCAKKVLVKCGRLQVHRLYSRQNLLIHHNVASRASQDRDCRVGLLNVSAVAGIDISELSHFTSRSDSRPRRGSLSSCETLVRCLRALGVILHRQRARKGAHQEGDICG